MRSIPTQPIPSIGLQCINVKFFRTKQFEQFERIKKSKKDF